MSLQSMQSRIFLEIQSSQLNLKVWFLQSMRDDSGASETGLNVVCFVHGCPLAEKTQLSALRVTGLNCNSKDGSFIFLVLVYCG